MSIATIKSDAQIKTDVLNELRWDPTVDETEVGVQVREGGVTLTGNVSSYAKKLAAIDAAHRVYGVLDVVDDMKVRLATAWERTDQDVAAAVRQALRWDVTVPEDRITSTVSAGLVTLDGTVDNWAERLNAERAVQRLTGVRGVVNRIALVARRVDAERIKSQIEEALERQAQREARRLGIAVFDGVVTVTGILRSWGEKNALERVAWSAPGVRRVDDQTIVDPYQ